MSDLLEQATRALRETSAEPQPRSGLTRARVLDSAEKRYVRRRGAGSLLRWTAAMFAALAASTALAHFTQYWPEIKRAFAPESVEHRDVVPAKWKTPAKKPAQPAAAEPSANPAADAPVVATPAVDPPVIAPPEVPAVAPAPETPAASNAETAPRSAPARSKRIARRTTSVAPRVIESESVAPVAPAPPVVTLTPAPDTESADLALFRRAQRLHLNRDPRALTAWDDYLRVAGSGPLAPEARYNRALCLVRSGRKAEAKAALAPFANGAYGTYRRTEAAELIKALDAAQ